jgi:hypothetical protein
MNHTDPARPGTRSPRAMVALVVQAEHLPMPTRITFQGKGVGQSGASIMCLWFRSNAEGQAWSEHLGGRAGLHVSAETGRTWLDHGPIDWHGWPMILHADDEPAEDGQSDTDAGSGGQPTPEGPCWPLLLHPQTLNSHGGVRAWLVHGGLSARWAASTSVCRVLVADAATPSRWCRRYRIRGLLS